MGQDGRTHWAASGAPLAQGRTGAEGALTHGLNLSVCVTPASAESGLWVVPVGPVEPTQPALVCNTTTTEASAPTGVEWSA